MPRAWPLKPSGLSATQKEFRLLFVTSTTRNATSSNIADYNSYVQGRAAAGHSAVRSFSSKFRAVASTSAVNARDNTATTYTSSDKGPPIYWLRGNKAADNYEDFYDGSWDEDRNIRNEYGNAHARIKPNAEGRIWTGSNNDGTEHSSEQLGGSSFTARQGRLGGGLNARIPLSATSEQKASLRYLYGLSPVIKLVDKVAVQGVSIESSPANATPGYAAGETIRVRLDFGEAVSVTDSPYLVLNIAGAARRATYASGSGTRYLNFEYTVQAADFDSDGISLCSNTSLDAGCGRITLNRGSISAQSDGLAAELDLPEFGRQSDHKVEGTPDDFTPDPGVGPMPSPSMGTVPRNWPLKPEDVGFGGRFRLLFITSTRNGSSSTIDDYNQHAINDAGAGHSAIMAYMDGFRVIASTASVDARDNARAHRNRGENLLAGRRNEGRGQLRRPTRRVVGQREPVRQGGEQLKLSSDLDWQHERGGRQRFSASREFKHRGSWRNPVQSSA